MQAKHLKMRCGTVDMRRMAAAAAMAAILGCLSSCGGEKAIRYYNLGVEAAQRGDLNEAIAMWRSSLEHRPDDPDTRYNLGMAYLQKEQYQDALRHFKAADAIRPDDHELQYALGRALEMMRDYTGAKRAYRYAHGLKLNFHAPLTGLASIALLEEQYGSAEKFAAEAIKFAPLDARANLILAGRPGMPIRCEKSNADLDEKSLLWTEEDFGKGIEHNGWRLRIPQRKNESVAVKWPFYPYNSYRSDRKSELKTAAIIASAQFFPDEPAIEYEIEIL